MELKFVDGRQVVFSALVGSQNKGLGTADSDFDYKQFVLPTFEDLYTGNRFVKEERIGNCEFFYADIRELPRLLSKGNPTYLEMLFSNELEYVSAFDEVVVLRELLIEEVKSKMLSCTLGHIKQCLSAVEKPTLTDKECGKKLALALGLYQLTEYYSKYGCYEEAFTATFTNYHEQLTLLRNGQLVEITKLGLQKKLADVYSQCWIKFYDDKKSASHNVIAKLDETVQALILNSIKELR